MRTVEVQLPEPVFQQALELASRENVPVEQLISMAVSQAIGVWAKPSDSAGATKVADRKRFLDTLQRALDSEQNGFRQFAG
jgi:hypothetical protein